jgi:hypothetical protein
MSTMHMRPRFDLEVEQPVEKVMSRLEEQLASEECPCRGDVYDHQIEIRIRKPHHHYWSPELNLLLEERDESGTRLHGKFGPGAHVWTLFMAGYAAFGMVAAAGLLIIMSQWMIGEELWGTWLVVGGAVGCGLVYLAARVGQRLAAPQMSEIRELIYDAFPDERGAV